MKSEADDQEDQAGPQAEVTDKGVLPLDTGPVDSSTGPDSVQVRQIHKYRPTYRSRYAEFLKIDFPRLPLTRNTDLFRALCAIGEQLVGLHLMEKTGIALPTFPIEGSNIVEAVRYTEPGTGRQTGCVWINKTQYFEGVAPEVWEFQVGGYQVCQKWLKDRKGRTLAYDDLEHYRRVCAALAETMRLMVAIDEAIDDHGGWSQLTGSE